MSYLRDRRLAAVAIAAAIDVYPGIR